MLFFSDVAFFSKILNLRVVPGVESLEVALYSIYRVFSSNQQRKSGVLNEEERLSPDSWLWNLGNRCGYGRSMFCNFLIVQRGQ
jgi:hypothetical protein